MSRKLIWSYVLVLWMFLPLAKAEDLRYTVGLKTWMADFTIEDKSISQKIESDLAYLWGITASVRGEKWVVGLNSMTGRFNFPNDVYLDRSESDFYGGYYFHPRIGVLIGYKYYIFEDVDNIEYTYIGPALALTGFYPTNFFSTVVFGTFTYAALSNTDDETDEFEGPSIEFGLAGQITSLPSWSYSVAYKYQVYEDNVDITQEISGISLGLNYLF